LIVILSISILFVSIFINFCHFLGILKLFFLLVSHALGSLLVRLAGSWSVLSYSLRMWSS
jgi:hypothetical protein